ncbi:MAG: bacterial transcriptional activator domain-containing protein [Clostridiales bacterium]|nr:bacterial transcriptional activator domain-containing protein [Clostridiales bacterium]
MEPINHTTAPDTVVTVSTFGGLEISTQRGTLTEYDISSGQVVKLLTYFFLNPDIFISRQMLSHAISPNADVRETPMQVKNTLHRARQITASILDGSLILTTGNYYHVNPDLHIVTDCSRFDELARSIRSNDNPIPEKARDLYEISRLYKQDFLPGFLDDPWINNHRTHYHFAYLDLVKNMLSQMSEAQSYREMISISGCALELEPCDGALHYWNILSMTQLGMLSLAVQHFYKFSAFLDADKQKELHALLLSIGKR